MAAERSAARLLDTTRRRTTIGLVVVVTLVAFEAMAVATVLPAAADELGGIRLYGWACGRLPGGHRDDPRPAVPVRAPGTVAV